MKQLFTLCLFVFSLVFSVQSLDAQNNIEINKVASEKAKEIRKTIKINSIQLEEVYQAYRTYETTYQKISADLGANQQELDKINLVLDSRLKDILTEEQFDNYISTYRPNQEVSN